MRIVNRVPELVAQKFGGEDKINLKQVERDSGLSYPTVSAWIKDRVDRADFPILASWCVYLGCTPCDILVMSED